MYSTLVVGGTLKSRRVASPLVKLVEGDERWGTPDHPQGVLPQNWGRTEQNSAVSCMVLKTKANDRRKSLALSHDEFRGPRFGVTVDQIDFQIRFDSQTYYRTFQGSSIVIIISSFLKQPSQERLKSWANWTRTQSLCRSGGLVSFSAQP
ncbi:uncharacterized protein TNCV_310411 [Trichonephila clavipes]|nr:uncharacterized protein TNCV_310411 [Trichonephila clavipes]